jgi:Na+/H+ antiporter NhaC
MRAAVVPIATLVVAIPAIFYLWDTSPPWPPSWGKLQDAFSGAAGPYALTLGSLLGLAVALAMVPADRRDQAAEGARRGAASMLSPLAILVCAWALGGVLKELGTADRIGEVLGSSIRPAHFPAAVFACSAAMSFVTGTSWGTMALMMPLAVPVAAGAAGAAPALEPLLPLSIAAVFSGAVFGDHCSPFSDTTIMSSIACGIRPLDHVVTQLPYATLAAALAAAAFLAAAGLRSPVLPLCAGVAGLTGLVALRTRRQPLP